MNNTITKYGAICLAIVAIIVAVVALGHKSASNVGSVYQPAGGTVYYQADTYAVGLNIGQKYQNWVSFVLNTGVNQASWYNNTGHLVYISGARFALGSTTPNGQVSSGGAYVLSVGTSTTATISDVNGGSYGGLINKAAIATSSSAYGAGAVVFVGNSGTSAFGSVIPVPTGQYLNVSLETATTGSLSATSTSRAFIVNGIIEYSF